MNDDAADDTLDDETYGLLDYVMRFPNGISVAGLRSDPKRDRDADSAAVVKLVALGFIEVPPEPGRPIVTTDKGRRAWEPERRKRGSGPEQ